MIQRITCPFLSDSSQCMAEKCAFWDGKADEGVPKGKCVLVRAAYALSSQVSVYAFVER